MKERGNGKTYSREWLTSNAQMSLGLLTFLLVPSLLPLPDYLEWVCEPVAVWNFSVLLHTGKHRFIIESNGRVNCSRSRQTGGLWAETQLLCQKPDGQTMEGNKKPIFVVCDRRGTLCWFLKIFRYSWRRNLKEFRIVIGKIWIILGRFRPLHTTFSVSLLLSWEK